MFHVSCSMFQVSFCMAKFTYIALTKDRHREASTIEAVDSIAAGHLLKDQGLMPVEIKEIKDSVIKSFFAGFSSIKLQEKIVFIEDLEVMLKAGIAAPRALKILVKQTKNKKFNKALADIAHQVESGKGLHEALESYPKIFSHIFVSMVKVGELSGNLEKSLEYLGIQLEREADLKSKTKGAMIYPAVIVSAMVIIGFLMAVFVLPKLTATFKEFGGELPLMTRIVVLFTDFISGNAIIVGALLIGAVAGVFFGMRTAFGNRMLDSFLIRVPMISPIVKKINLARMCRVLSSMMKSGISIVEGLQVTSEALGNVFYREAISAAGGEIKLGKNFTASLEKDPRLFPVILVQMLQVGEETGTMETILQQLAEHYEAEVDNTMRNLSSIIEPILLLVIGAVVGVLALALISPIYNLSQSVN